MPTNDNDLSGLGTSPFQCGHALYADDLTNMHNKINTILEVLRNGIDGWNNPDIDIPNYSIHDGALWDGNTKIGDIEPQNQNQGLQILTSCPSSITTTVQPGTLTICQTDGHVYIYTGNQNHEGDNTPGWFDLGEGNWSNTGDGPYYGHVAYADHIGFSGGQIVSQRGFTTSNNDSQKSYLWTGICVNSDINDPGYNLTSSSNPTDILNAVKAYKWNYMRGSDSNGLEFIYMLGKGNVKPEINQALGIANGIDGKVVDHTSPTFSGPSYASLPDVKTTDEFLPLIQNVGPSQNENEFYIENGKTAAWFDDPPTEVSSEWPVLYQAFRKKKDGVWGYFSGVMKLEEYVDLSNIGSGEGSAGTGTVLAFRAFTDQTAANTAYDSIKSSNSNPPSGWNNDNNITVESNQMLFMIYAYTQGGTVYDPSNSNPSVYWHGPYRIGSDGTTSGTGSDNDQYNYIYCRNNSSIAPNIPSASADWTNIISTIESQANENKFINISDTSEISNTYVQNYWTDHPYGVSEEITYEWMIGCTKGNNNSYSYAFGPIIFSHYGERGMDGDGIEYIFRVMADGLAAPTFSENENHVQYHDNGRIGENGSVISSRVYTNSEDTNYQQDDFIPQNWHDEPQIISSSFPKQYVSIRKQDNGVWGPFSTPRLWSESNSSSSDSYTIDGGNTSFVIDDQTVDDNLIGIATINFITVTKGGSVMVPGATGDYYISVTNKSLPKYNNLDVLTEEISYANGKASIKLKLNPNVNLPNDYTFTPGLYTYDVEIYVKEGEVYKLVSTKVHKLTINSDVSTDGSIYRLYVLNDSLSFYYNDSNNQWTIQNSISPRIFAYKFNIGGTSEKVSTYKIIDDISNPGKIDGTTITSQNESTYFTNGIYIEVGSLINNVTNNNNELIFSNLSGVGYQVGGYQIGLYEKKGNNIIPLEFHTIGCTKDGKNGVFDSSSALGYSFFIENQCSYLDDQINSDSALKTLTLSGIKVYCNGDDISTDNSISYSISSSSVPNSTTNVSFLEVVADQNNKNNFYLRRKTSYSQSGTTNYNNANGYKLVPTDTNNNYYYTVTVTRTVNGTNITLGVVKFQIFVDENISSDGTSYKLYIENPILHYNSSEELQNRENFKISIYKVDNQGSQKLTLRLSSGENQVMFMNQLPASTNDGIFYIISNLPSTHNSNGTELTYPYTISSGDIVLSNDLTYTSSSYNLSLYKGSTYEDGPESVQCLKDPTIPNSQTGLIHKMYYYAGEVGNDLTDYENCIATKYQAPYVKYNGDFYVLNVPDSDLVLGQYIATAFPEEDENHWTKMEGGVDKFYMAEAYFGEFAKFGSAIISGDYLISTNGKINGTEYTNGQTITVNGASVPAYTKFIYEPTKTIIGTSTIVGQNIIYFDIPSGVTIKVIALNKGTSNDLLTFTLYDNSNQSISSASKSVTGGLSNQFTYTINNSGRYHIRVSGNNIPYQLTYEFTGIFEPNYWVNLLTGEMGAANNNFVLSNSAINIGKGSLIVDNDGNLTAKGNITSNKFSTDGTKGYKIEITGGTFNVYNSKGEVGISIGWDEDGDPYINIYKSEGGTSITKDGFQTIITHVPDRMLDYPLIKVPVSGTSLSANYLYNLQSSDITKYLYYSAAKNLRTGEHDSTDASGNQSNDDQYKQFRDKKDGLVFETNTAISNVLSSNNSYCLTGYYLSPIQEGTTNLYSRVLLRFDEGVHQEIGRIFYKYDTGSLYSFCDGNGIFIDNMNYLNESNINVFVI